MFIDYEKFMNKNIKSSILLFALLTVLSGCAKHYASTKGVDAYGFFSGLWHGMIFYIAACGCFISWVCSLFGAEVLDNVQIIGRPNTGFGYYTGFIIAMLHLRLLG